MSASDIIAELSERFIRNLESYRSGGYNETQLRREFLDPFFEALGWDVNNRQGYAEAYKDVIHEDAIKVGGATKAPDYCFRIGGTRKFFVEAKKPSINVKEDISPAFQLRRYAWSAKLPLSILTDFEEFAVYDCRVKPEKTDKASNARILYLTHNQYIEKWDEIVSIFSREAVLKGSFDKYAETGKGKKGTATVDDAFLKEIESWRDMLARNIAIRNPNLTQRELNFTIQLTIDRIIFLRICEDRGVEEYGRLMTQLNGANIYRRLLQLFRYADERYNSGLFHFDREKDRPEAPDELTPNLAIDDKPLKEIITRLYYPESPYEFSVLPADILGQVYEQFLGKVIRLTAGHHAVVEEKPEVRKAGGVYYTPTYIVDYIVKNTVGKLLGSEARDRGSEVRDQGKGGVYGDSDISGSGSLAGSNESDNRCISSHKSIPEGRTLRIDKPDTACGCISACQHSGGTQPKIEKGISSSCINSQGLSIGVGNSSYDCQPSGISPTAGNGQDMGGRTKSGATAKRTHSISQTSDPRALTPADVSKIRILDPACGSGSFLLGAYQYLLDWHRDWYINNEPQKWANGKNPAIYQSPTADSRSLTPDPRSQNWHLTTSEKKRILLNNIYGVDIDTQAVEVTKLSLLLKVLEGESSQTIERQMKFFHERALPDLGSNIKCGNSLIGPDFYEQQTMLDDEERYRVNVFDWNAEFPKIMKAGGFDAVIGNPPYVIVSTDIFSQTVIEYLKIFPVAQYKMDLFHLFIQKGIELLKKDGRFGYIVPNTWLTLKYTDKLRQYVLENTAIEELVIFDHYVFKTANVHTALLFANKIVVQADHEIKVKKPHELTLSRELEQTMPVLVPQNSWVNSEGCIFETRLTGDEGEFAARIIEKWPRLETVARASLGCQAYNSSKHTPEQIAKRIFHATTKIGKDYLPELAGKDVSRYLITRERGEWIHYGSWLHDYRTMDWLTGPRILIREIIGPKPHQIQACYVEETYCHYKTILNVNPSASTNFSMKYLTGILSSRLLSFLYPFISNKMVARSFPRLSVGDVRKLSVRTIDFSNPTDKVHHDKIVYLVDQMLSFNKQLATARTDHEKTSLQRQIDATDKQIDKLVYELYGLTEEEIGIVEDG